MSSFSHQKVIYQSFSEEEQREIVFKDITTGEVTHTTVLDTAGIADYRSVIGYFTKAIMDDLRLVMRGVSKPQHFAYGTTRYGQRCYSNSTKGDITC